MADEHSKGEQKMLEPQKEEENRLARFERIIQGSQLEISELLYKYKLDNGAIKHLAIYNYIGQLLAHCPDDEVQNSKLLLTQYNWIATIFSPALQAVKQGNDAFVNLNKKRTVQDFGRPRVIQLQTENGDAVKQVFATPIDHRALIFVVATTRAATRRNAFVVNEGLLLQDLEALSQELLKSLDEAP